MANNTEKRLRAVFEVDSTGFNDGLKGVNRSLRNAKSELKLASEGIKAFGTDSNRLKSVQESLAKQVELHSKKVDIYKQSIEKTTSKMKDNIRARDELKNSLDKANKKYEEAVKIHGKESTEAKKAKKEVDNLTEEYKKKEKAVKSNARSIQNYETNMNKANAEVVKTKAELEKINSELDKSNNKWLKASEGLKKNSEKLKNVGNAVSSVGDKILKLSAPVAAVGIASTKLVTDLNEGMAKISTLIPGQGERLQELKKSVQDVSINVGKSTDDIADGTYNVISAFGDASDTMKKVEIDAKAATAGMATTTDALNLSSAVMKGYGSTTAETNKKVMDLAFNTVKLGQTSFSDLAGSIGKVVPLSNELGISMEELFNIYATGTGVTGNASEVTTQFKGVLKSLMAPTEDMANLMTEMGVADGKAMIAKYGLMNCIEEITKKAKETNTPLQKYIGSIEGQTIALALAGEQSEVYRDKLEEMKNSSGAMEEAFREQTEGINRNGFTWQQSMQKIKVAGQKLGEAMSPILSKGADLLSNLADKLNGLSKEQLKSIAKWGMFSIATGGALKVVGGGISTIGTISGGLSKLTGFLGKTTMATKGVTTATGLATKGMSAMGLATKASTLLLNPWAIGIGAVTLAGVGLAKHLKKDVVPSVDLFANKVEYSTKKVKKANGEVENSVTKTTTKISQGTKKAVGSYMKLDENAKKHLMNLYINGTKITKNTANGIVKTYKDMGTQIKDGIDKDHKEQMKKMQEFFAKTQTITKEEQREMFTSLQEHNNKQKAEIDKYEKEIQAILDKASKEKRELKADEMQKIDEIQEKMKVNAVKTLSEEEVESKVILERLKAHSERLTTEQASEVIKNAEKQRQGAVEKAEKQYDETVTNIIRMRDESKTITAEQADKMIKEAERQKQESIDKASEMKETVVEKIREMNRDTLENIDENDGHIKTKWENLKSWFANNPIMRTIKSVVQNSQAELEGAGHNWTGTNYWQGGLTYLHDSPGINSNYELYDLPRGSRIYNHDASEDLVIKTAENVATKVANSVLKNFGNIGARGQEQTIIVPVNIDGREIARITAKPMSEELGKLNKRGGLGYV